MQKNFSAVNGQSNFDVCLNTYGSLDLLYKMLLDSGVDNVNVAPYSGQVFIYDDSLIVDQRVNQNYTLKGIIYATDIGQKGSVYYVIRGNTPSGKPTPIFPVPPNSSDMYKETAGTTFTSNANGTTIIVPTDKDGNSMVGYDIVQLEMEIKPLLNNQWQWNKPAGQLTLLGGLTLDDSQTLFIIYNKTIQ